MYKKNNIITSNPNIPNVVNPSHETILNNGWEVYEVPPKSELELRLEEWQHTNFLKKIVAPAELIEEYPQIVAWALCNPDKLLIEVRDTEAHVYYNELKDNHLELVQTLGLIEQNIPK